MLPHRRLAAVAAATALAVTACGDDATSGEVVGGAAAPDEAVTDTLEIAALELEYPDDGLWDEGESVHLYAAIANSGRTDVRLVDVEGEAFGDAELIGLSGEEGAIEVRQDDNAYLEPEGPPSILLVDLQESLRSSQSIEVTFVFEDAGEVTMEAPVASAPPGDGDFSAPEDPTPEDG